MDAGENGGAVWLTLSEAAGRLGVTVDALRSRIRRGQVSPRRGNDGRLLVPVSADLSAPSQDHDEAGHDHPPDQRELLDELHGELLELRVALARSEERLVAAERREAAAEAAAAREQARADLAARIVELRAELVQARAELAEARKPALVRLVEALRRR